MSVLVNADVSNIKLPEMNTLRVISNSGGSKGSKSSMVNGKMIQSWEATFNYIVQAIEAGDKEIGAVEVTVDGKTYRSAPVIVKVVAGEVNQQNRTLDKELFLKMVNEIRAKGCNCGKERFAPTTPLKWSDVLEAAAQVHSTDMYTKVFLSHTGSDGSNQIERAKRQGYNSSFVGENAHQGSTTEKSAFDAWMKSIGHCKNIMNPQYTEIGVARDDDYWTMKLGNPDM